MRRRAWPCHNYHGHGHNEDATTPNQLMRASVGFQLMRASVWFQRTHPWHIALDRRLDPNPLLHRQYARQGNNWASKSSQALATNYTTMLFDAPNGRYADRLRGLSEGDGNEPVEGSGARWLRERTTCGIWLGARRLYVGSNWDLVGLWLRSGRASLGRSTSSTKTRAGGAVGDTIAAVGKAASVRRVGIGVGIGVVNGVEIESDQDGGSSAMAKLGS